MYVFVFIFVHGFVGQEDYRLAKHIDNTKKGISRHMYKYTYIYIYI
jgi:hypothetical protein